MASTLKLVVAVWILLIGGCATVPSEPDWPQELPPRMQFEAVWQAAEDNREVQSLEDFLSWILRFYEGNNLVPGWLGMTSQLQSRIAPADWLRHEPVLFSLGAQIAAEWAQDNQFRRINTRCAAVWRDALQEALSRDDLDPFLARLQDDVDALVNGELHQDQIRFERYYVDEFDF